MVAISPFGSNAASGTPNISVQKFCGASVSSFTCSADWSSQGGNLSVVLVEDDVNGDKLNVPIMSAPAAFSIVDDTSSGVFSFNGLYDSISRNTSPSEGKVYNVSVSSPLKILQAVSIMTDVYTGYGSGIEGLPQYFSDDGYYNIDDTPENYLPDGVSKVPSVDYYKIASLSFGTNNSNLNYTGMWANQYNIINVFGAYENDSIGIVSFKGFGASAISEEGMTLDRLCYALDYIINKTTSAATTRYLGGNMLFGTNTYNVCSVANGYTAPYPYYYGFDAIGFYNQVVNYIGKDYRIKGPLSILDMVQQVCDEINADFQVNLDFISYVSGDFTDYAPTYSVYDGTDFQLSKTYTNSLLGGVISVQVNLRNTYTNCQKPFSEIAYALIGLEKPDFGSYGDLPGIHPGLDSPFDISFYQPSFGGVFDPLDDDYALVGTKGSAPYGGKFPVPTDADSEGTLLTEVLNRASNVSVSVKATDATTAKMVIGGFQTRMVNVPRDYIYQYWGDLLLDNPIESGMCESLSRSSQKKIPVVTQILPPNDIMDSILVDVKEIIPRTVYFWDSNYWTQYTNIAAAQTAIAGRFVVVEPISSGIYSASVAEIRAAMTSKYEWMDYLETIKPSKLNAMTQFFEGYSRDINQITKLNNQAENINFRSLNIKEYKIRQQNGSAKYTGFKKELTFIGHIEEPDEVDDDLFLNKIYEKLKSIGDEHYGKSWYAPIPFFATKVTENDDNLLGNYTRSWDLADSAYVEPSLYYTIDAPMDSKFMNEGKLLPFVNYEYAISGTGELGYDLFTNKIKGFVPNGVNHYDFSEYSKDSIAVDKSGCKPNQLAHVPPSYLSSDYELLPCSYFSTYNRYSMPFFDITTVGSVTYAGGVPSRSITQASGLFGQFYSYDSPYKTGILPTGALNGCGVSARLVTATFEDSSKLTVLDSNGIINSGHNGFFIQYPTDANAALAINMLNLAVADHGLNTIPFVKFQTERVYYPYASSSGLEPGSNPAFALRLALMDQDITQQNADLTLAIRPQIKELSQFNSDFRLFPPVLAPRSVCIPQVSNRYVYGPWLSNYTILYAGKVEVEQDLSLVPENYLIPAYGTVAISGGTFSSGISSQTSGFAGMNLAGQAIANSIDNFSMFAAEEGTVTIPGLPLINKIGQNLLTGPRITDLQVDISNNQISTTYNFRQNSPRLGRTNKDIVKKLGKIGNTIRK